MNESSGSVGSIVKDMPTIPSDVPEDGRYVYDFLFSERYDNKITDSFSLILPQEMGQAGLNTFFLYQKYVDEMGSGNQHVYHGDGMVPYQYKAYDYNLEGGRFVVQTHFYELDSAEYIFYLWTDIEGAKTNLNVGIGSSECDLLAAYTDGLFYLSKEQTEPDWIQLREDGCASFAFDYAYAWQPFTVETK